MKQSLYLAFRYIGFHSVRTTVLIFSLGIIIYLPIGLKKLIGESEMKMMARAKTTPLLIGAKGSSTDLVINSLYFKQEKIDPISMELLTQVNKLEFGYGIPILSMFSARNFPIVGTDPDYFSFRKLSLDDGRWMSYVGECVIGVGVAENLGLGVGDSLISSPENFFDLAGVYPLKMNIVGVLNKTDTPDDRAVFVDIKTNWVILGLGHGHEDLKQVYDPTIVLERDSNVVKAGAKLFLYNTINGENMDSFHFHGDINSYPLSSIIFVPKDHKSETILRGRFESGELIQQIIVPEMVVTTLLQSIFRIKQIFNTVFILVGVATILILSLIVTLSLRLRKDELHTMFTIGSSRRKVAEIVTFELLILLISSAIFAWATYLVTGMFVEEFINNFIL